MNTFNKKNHWKQLIKKATVLSAAALVFASCGKDTENQIIADSVTDTVTTNPVIVGIGTDSDNFWQSAKSQNICPNGSSRMADKLYTMQTNSYQASGSLTGGQTSGTVTQTYTGMNPGTKDLVFIAQVVNGSVTSYNVAVSLCSWNNGQVELIGDSAGLSNFSLVNLQLNNATNCPTGKIEGGWLTFYSQAYAQANPYDHGFIPTTLAPLCN